MTLEFITHEPDGEADSCIIWLHGLGADGHDFEPLMPELGRWQSRYIFPHAPVRPVTVNNQMRMRAWYDFLSMEFLDSENLEHLQASVDSIHDLINEQLKSSIPAEKIILAGFSQGGVISLLAGLGFTQKLGGVIALSTYLPSKYTFNNSQDIPVLQCHGTEDPIIPLQLAQHSATRLQTMVSDYQWRDYPMAHSLCAEEIQDIKQWLIACLG